MSKSHASTQATCGSTPRLDSTSARPGYISSGSVNSANDMYDHSGRHPLTEASLEAHTSHIAGAAEGRNFVEGWLASTLDTPRDLMKPREWEELCEKNGKGAEIEAIIKAVKKEK